MGFFGGNDRNNVVNMADMVEAANVEEVTQEEGMDQEELEKEPKQSRRPFAIWEVGGKSYKLKLRTPAIVELEKKYKTNLMNIMGSGNGGMPALSVMLDVAHAAMKDWQHGITKAAVNNLFEKYIEEGGSQLSFYMSVYMDIFTVSGFFSVNLSNQMAEAMTEAQEEL